jgi:hypothetical protein
LIIRANSDGVEIACPAQQVGSEGRSTKSIFGN